MSKIRKHYVNVRFSDNEFEKLNAQMILEGYRNRSKYIRETLLVKRQAAGSSEGGDCPHRQQL